MELPSTKVIFQASGRWVAIGRNQTLGANHRPMHALTDKGLLEPRPIVADAQKLISSANCFVEVLRRHPNAPLAGNAAPTL